MTVLPQRLVSFSNSLKKPGLKQEFVIEFQVNSFTVNILHLSRSAFLPSFIVILPHVLLSQKSVLCTALLSYNLPLKDVKPPRKQGILHPAETRMEETGDPMECSRPAINFGVMKLMLWFLGGDRADLLNWRGKLLAFSSLLSKNPSPTCWSQPCVTPATGITQVAHYRVKALLQLPIWSPYQEIVGENGMQPCLQGLL